jgi:NAD(P)-dependent dehydrogenase (short-subunit alcohol dehydrogenase family)
MIDVGVTSAVVASWHAAQLMVPNRRGLIVAISGYTGVSFTFTPVFGMCKSAVDRLARDMAVDLEPHHVCSVSLWQALTVTEKVQMSMARDPAQSRSNTSPFGAGSSVEHPGRVVAALAADPDVMRHSGGTFITAELAAEYGIVDVDGREIASLRESRGTPIWKPLQQYREPAAVR